MVHSISGKKAGVPKERNSTRRIKTRLELQDFVLRRMHSTVDYDRLLVVNQLAARRVHEVYRKCYRKYYGTRGTRISGYPDIRISDIKISDIGDILRFFYYNILINTR